MPIDVALFVTCLTDQFYPQVGVAVTKVLRHYGCAVHFPADQTCCGLPSFTAGLHEDARQLARRMVEVFEPYSCIVTPSAACCAMVREHFPRLLKGDHAWEAGCRKLSANTYEFVEFLDRVLKIDFGLLKLPSPTTVTYHYNCQLRSLGTSNQPLLRLQEIRNVDFHPMDQAEECCGFGGTFALNYPAVSGAISDEKARTIAATGAQVVVSNDPGCSMTIAGACHRHGVQTRVKHMAELIAEALGLDVSAL